jgi:hypothetical protein
MALGKAEKSVILKLAQMALVKAKKKDDIKNGTYGARNTGRISDIKMSQMALGKSEKSLILLEMAQVALGKSKKSVILLKMSIMALGKAEKSVIF